MLKLDAQTTALVLIDLQNGILPYAGGPHSADQVVANAALLAARFRLLGAPVLLVRVGWSDTFAEALKQPVDKPAPAPTGGLPASWWEFPHRWRSMTAIFWSPNANGAPSTAPIWIYSCAAAASNPWCWAASPPILA